MSHPDDVTAVCFAIHSATFDLGEVAKEIITALDAVRAKRLPADVAGVIDDLRNMRACGKILPEMCGAAADLIEAQATALEAATARAEKAEAEVERLRRAIVDPPTILTM